MKIHPVGAELFHAGGWTNRDDEANRRFSQFCEKRLNTPTLLLVAIRCAVLEHGLRKTKCVFKCGENSAGQNHNITTGNKNPLKSHEFHIIGNNANKPKLRG